MWFLTPLVSLVTTGNRSSDPHRRRQPAGVHGPPEEAGGVQLRIDETSTSKY